MYASVHTHCVLFQLLINNGTSVHNDVTCTFLTLLRSIGRHNNTSLHVHVHALTLCVHLHVYVCMLGWAQCLNYC